MVFLDVSKTKAPGHKWPQVKLLLTFVHSNLPFGAATLVLVFLSFELHVVGNPSQKLALRSKLKHLDPVGIVLLLSAVCCLLLVLQKGGTSWPWRSARTIGLLSAAVVILLSFGFVQSALGDRATVPVRVLRDRTVLAGSLFLAISNASSYVVSLDSLEGFEVRMMVQSLQ